ncbi:MAG: leucine-rich repeat domain-containing protein [Candidatus Thorarchaeota archaeon]
MENKKFKKVLKTILKEKNYKKFTHYKLVQILINYFTISNLFKQYYNVDYEISSQNGLIEKLDLSDFLEYEVKGTPWDWKNNINDLSEIPGLTNLNHITHIDLSNNQIKDIKDLIHFQELTHLIVSNNKLSADINLYYIKNLPNLIYLDLRGNDIVDKIKPNDFNPQTRVLLRDLI